jgi:hypothetical protein
MGRISINYDEGNKENLGYESVEIKFRNEKYNKSFSSGDFIKDWYDMRKYMINDVDMSDDEPYFIHSSSVDHFIMDGAPYDSAYLHIVDDKPVLKYFDRTDPNWFLQGVDEGGIEFFVPENTQPTWEEFRDKYKDEE